MFPDLAQLLMQLGMGGAESGLLMPSAAASDLGGLMAMGNPPGSISGEQIPQAAAPPTPPPVLLPEGGGGVGGDYSRDTQLYPLLQQPRPPPELGVVDPAQAGFGGGASPMTTGGTSPTAQQAAARDAANKAALQRLAQIRAPDAPKPPQPGVPGGVKAPETKMQVGANAPAIQALIAALLGGGGGGLRVPTLGDLMRG